MESFDLAELIVKAIEQTVIKEWRHEGYIDCFQSDIVNAVIDGKRYSIKLFESEMKE